MLKDKAIIVTGAASGIGRAAAVRFAELGAYVVAVDRAPEVESTAATIVRAGGQARHVQADISDEQAVEQFVKGAVDVKGKLDGAFNNAGIVQRSSMLHELSLDEWNRVNSVNFAGTFLCVKHQIAAMLKTGGGSIVNTSSALGAVAVERHGAYTASRMGKARRSAIQPASLTRFRLHAHSRLPHARIPRPWFGTLRTSRPIKNDPAPGTSNQ